MSNHSRYFRDLLYARKEARRAELFLNEFEEVSVDHMLTGDLRVAFQRPIPPDVHQWLMDNGWRYERNHGYSENGYVYLKSMNSRATVDLLYIGRAASFLGMCLCATSTAFMTRLVVWGY